MVTRRGTLHTFMSAGDRLSTSDRSGSPMPSGRSGAPWQAALIACRSTIHRGPPTDLAIATSQSTSIRDVSGKRSTIAAPERPTPAKPAKRPPLCRCFATYAPAAELAPKRGLLGADYRGTGPAWPVGYAQGPARAWRPRTPARGLPVAGSPQAEIAGFRSSRVAPTHCADCFPADRVST
jgi:hypothetical protein